MRDYRFGSEFLRRAIGTAIASLLLVTALAAGLTAPAAAAPLSQANTVEDLRWSEEFRVHHADVLRLYYAFFNREPDLEGAQHWIATIDGAATLDDIAWSFSNSPEFVQRYGAVTDAQFVAIIYTNVLGRPYDQEGYDYWFGQLQTGNLTREGVVRWVGSSPEFKQRHPQTPTERVAKVKLEEDEFSSSWSLYFEQALHPQDEFFADCPIASEYGSLVTSWEPDSRSGPFVLTQVFPSRTVAEATVVFDSIVSTYTNPTGCDWSGAINAPIAGDQAWAGTTIESNEFSLVRNGTTVIAVRYYPVGNGPSTGATQYFAEILDSRVD